MKYLQQLTIIGRNTSMQGFIQLIIVLQLYINFKVNPQCCMLFYHGRIFESGLYWKAPIHLQKLERQRLIFWALGSGVFASCFCQKSVSPDSELLTLFPKVLSISLKSNTVSCEVIFLPLFQNTPLWDTSWYCFESFISILQRQGVRVLCVQWQAKDILRVTGGTVLKDY